MGADPDFIDMIADPRLTFTIPEVGRPLYLAPIIEPGFGTKVTRITDDPGKPTSPVTGTWGTDTRHHYSKDQPWNSNSTLIWVQNRGTGGTSRRLILDGETYAVKHGICSIFDYGDSRWHPSPQHPHERINVTKNGRELMWFDVVACVKSRSWTLAFKVEGLGQGEGNTSDDGRFVVLGDATRIFVVDMDPQPPDAPYPNQRIGPAYDHVSNCGIPGCSVGHVSISPSGKYAVVSYRGAYQRVFDVNPDTLALSPRPMPASSYRCTGSAANGYVYDLAHADMALNPFDNNEDVIVGKEHCRNKRKVVNGKLIGGVMMIRLRDGALTPLTDPTKEASVQHVSTRNYDRAGWAYVGYYPSGPTERFQDEIIAVKMDGSKAVQRFTHKHGLTSGCYRCEAHAVPSRDGRRVMWASNWGANCNGLCGPADGTAINAYVVDARIGTIVDRIPPAAPARQ